MFQLFRKSSPRISAITSDNRPLQTARRYFSSGAQDKALAIMAKIVAESPLDGEAHALLAQFHQKMGEMDTAKSLWQTALRLEPTRREWLHQAAEVALALGQTEGGEIEAGLKYASDGLKLDSNHPGLLQIYGMLRCASGNLVEGYAALQRLRQAGIPPSEWMGLQMAWVAAARQNLAGLGEILPGLRDVAEQNGGNPALLADYALALELYQDFGTAFEVWLACLAISPDAALEWKLAAARCAWLCQDTGTAARLLAEILAVTPKHPEALYWRDTMNGGDAETDSPEFRLRQVAKKALELGEIAVAEASLEEILRLNPASPMAAMMLGQLYVRDGNPAGWAWLAQSQAYLLNRLRVPLAQVWDGEVKTGGILCLLIEHPFEQLSAVMPFIQSVQTAGMRVMVAAPEASIQTLAGILPGLAYQTLTVMDGEWQLPVADVYWPLGGLPARLGLQSGGF